MADRGNRLLRTVDRYLGIPLVRILGFFRPKKRPLPKQIKHIGILATAAIGDTILMSAVLKDLKQRYPYSQLTLFVGPSNFEISKMFFQEQKIVLLATQRPFQSIQKIRRQGPFDLWIDFGPWPRLNALLSFFSRSHYRIGFKSKNQYRHYVYQLAVDHRDDCHEIDNLRCLVDCLHVDCQSIPTLPSHSKPGPMLQATVHMFPGGYKAHYKEWKEANWITLINYLTERGYFVLLTGAPKDQMAANLVYSKCQQPDKIENIAGRANLWETAQRLSRSQWVISVNTGIMHLAAAYNLPLIALNGPTSSQRWGALGPNSTNIDATSPSAGCLHLGFEYDHSDSHSLDTISVEQVIHHLARYPSQTSPLPSISASS